jgi:drug/metabolite transporter (DMT)-like permease
LASPRRADAGVLAPRVGLTYVNPMNTVHVGLLLVLSALIGAVYPLVKIAEETIPPVTLTLLRAFFATLLLLIVVGAGMRRSLSPLRTHWKTFALLGLLLSLFFISISEAEERISASLGALMACTVPSATFLIATLFLRWERFSWLRFAGTLVALGGVALFIGPDRLLSGRSELAGVAIIAGGFVLYAANMMYARSQDLDPFVIATGTLVVVTLFMAIAAFGLERPLSIQPSAASLMAAMGAGIFSTGLAYVILYYLVAHAGAVFTSTFCYIMPLFAILVSHLTLGDDLSWTHMAGVAVTLAGAALVNRKPEEIASANSPTR